jgi:uncharacterized protein
MNGLWQAVGVVVAATALLLGGCARSAPTRQYTLLPLAEASAPQASSTLTLGIGPVRLPQHLRQPALVRRHSAYSLTYGDFNVWADPLEELVVEVLAENLTRLHAARRVERYPWRAGETPDRQVSLEITAFELAADGQADLAARWELRDARGALLEAGQTLQREPAGGLIANLPEALSRALLAFSRELALDLQR